MICLRCPDGCLVRQPLTSSSTRGHRQQGSRGLRRQVSMKAVHPSRHLFVFGLGYTGRAVANTLSKSGWTISGTCRQPEQRPLFATQHIDTICITSDQISQQIRNQIVEALQHASHILCTIPPSSQDSLAAELVLAHAASSLQWIGYLSSTSVYGDWGGSWVDESSELRVAASKSTQRAEAEAAWLRLYHDHGLPVHVFRLGGIYGPGRSALDAVNQKGPASASQQRRSLQQYTARCHVQDICMALSASMQHPSPGSIYNVVDDDPASRACVMAFAAELLQALSASADDSHSVSACDAVSNPLQAGSRPAVKNSWQPTHIGAESRPPEMVENSNRAEKRVCNAKIKAELALALEFPSYREGLAAIHAGDLRPFD